MVNKQSSFHMTSLFTKFISNGRQNNHFYVTQLIFPPKVIVNISRVKLFQQKFVFWRGKNKENSIKCLCRFFYLRHRVKGIYRFDYHILEIAPALALNLSTISRSHVIAFSCPCTTRKTGISTSNLAQRFPLTIDNIIK